MTHFFNFAVIIPPTDNPLTLWGNLRFFLQQPNNIRNPRNSSQWNAVHIHPQSAKCRIQYMAMGVNEPRQQGFTFQIHIPRLFMSDCFYFCKITNRKDSITGNRNGFSKFQFIIHGDNGAVMINSIRRCTHKISFMIFF